MDVTITFYWGRRPSAELRSMFEEAQFQFQQTFARLGGAAFDKLHINLHLPISETDFGPAVCNVSVQRKKRRILANLVVDWEAYSSAKSDVERVSLVLDGRAHIAEKALNRLVRPEAADRHRASVLDIKNALL